MMGDFNHGHIEWESLESAGGGDHQFLLLTQDNNFIHFPNDGIPHKYLGFPRLQL